MWFGSNPSFAGSEYDGRRIRSVVSKKYRGKVDQALSNCFVRGKRTSLEVTIDEPAGHMRSQEPTAISVLLIPIPFPTIMGTAAMMISTVVPDALKDLPEHSFQILMMIAQGKSIPEIAPATGLSLAAVRSKVQRLKKLWGCKSMPQLVDEAHRRHIIIKGSDDDGS